MAGIVVDADVAAAAFAADRVLVLHEVMLALVLRSARRALDGRRAAGAGECWAAPHVRLVRHSVGGEVRAPGRGYSYNSLRAFVCKISRLREQGRHRQTAREVARRVARSESPA